MITFESGVEFIDTHKTTTYNSFICIFYLSVQSIIRPEMDTTCTWPAACVPLVQHEVIGLLGGFEVSFLLFFCMCFLTCFGFLIDRWIYLLHLWFAVDGVYLQLVGC